MYLRIHLAAVQKKNVNKLLLLSLHVNLLEGTDLEKMKKELFITLCNPKFCSKVLEVCIVFKTYISVLYIKFLLSLVALRSGKLKHWRRIVALYLQCRIIKLKLSELICHYMIC